MGWTIALYIANGEPWLAFIIGLPSGSTPGFSFGLPLSSRIGFIVGLPALSSTGLPSASSTGSVAGTMTAFMAGNIASLSAKSAFSAGTDWKPTGGVHGSMRVPPQLQPMSPTGTSSVFSSSRPKK